MSATPSSAFTAAISRSALSAPSTGAMRSRALASRRSGLSGFSAVPGGKRVWCVSVRPSVVVTSTMPPRGAAGSISARSPTTCTFAAMAWIAGSRIRAASWLSAKDTAPFTRASATRCPQFTSGMALAPTMPIASNGTFTSTWATSAGVSCASRRSASTASSGD